MKPREIRIAILDLQDQYCRSCKYHNDSFSYCLAHCSIGKNMYNLGSRLYPKENSRTIRSPKSWDKICSTAVTMKNKGISYSAISKKLGCSRTTLREHLKKRGLG
ncbi:TPA: zinc-finger domain-containing protein [Bacillus thuringiensis]|nr:zinc-finger domain-containing protein [Bacillus thuringiensis]